MGIFFSLGENLEIPLHANDCDLRNFPRKDDNVIFDISQVRATRETKAVNIRVVETTKAARWDCALETYMSRIKVLF